VNRRKALEIVDLSFSYPDGGKALDRVSLDVFEGESVGIIGANGAGKSTLLLHLNGILTGQGKVRIFEDEITPRNLREIRKIVGLVFQEPDDQLFNLTACEDVAFGPRNLGLRETEIDERVSRSLMMVGLQDFRDRRPDQLSFGEKKRISIATVLALEPGILALDEPTGGLDPRGRREMIDLLGSLGGTKVVVTHDLEAVGRLCERIAVMWKGRIVRVGTPDEILGDPSFLEKYSLA
jgi:cobalt/nickel transport system ATP-binding protein